MTYGGVAATPLAPSHYLNSTHAFYGYYVLANDLPAAGSRDAIVAYTTTSAVQRS